MWYSVFAFSDSSAALGLALSSWFWIFSQTNLKPYSYATVTHIVTNNNFVTGTFFHLFGLLLSLHPFYLFLPVSLCVNNIFRIKTPRIDWCARILEKFLSLLCVSMAYFWMCHHQVPIWNGHVRLVSHVCLDNVQNIANMLIHAYNGVIIVLWLYRYPLICRLFVRKDVHDPSIFSDKLSICGFASPAFNQLATSANTLPMHSQCLHCNLNGMCDVGWAYPMKYSVTPCH